MIINIKSVSEKDDSVSSLQITDDEGVDDQVNYLEEYTDEKIKNLLKLYF